MVNREERDFFVAFFVRGFKLDSVLQENFEFFENILKVFCVILVFFESELNFHMDIVFSLFLEGL